jgi:hypothetical protein
MVISEGRLKDGCSLHKPFSRIRAQTQCAVTLIRLTTLRPGRVYPGASKGGHGLRGTNRSSDRTLNVWLKKAAVMISLASLIGVLDDLQVRYIGIANYGTEVEIIYQLCFLIASATVAYGALHSKSWSTTRNMSNLLMALPISAIADNVSIDAGTLRPYVLLIPRQGYVWRQAVFGHSEGLSYMANWVNQQSIAPSLINGYVASILLAAVYIVVQFAWIHRMHSNNLEI